MRGIGTIVLVAGLSAGPLSAGCSPGLLAFAEGGPAGESSAENQSVAARIVMETMDSGDYTYAKVQAGEQTYWLAAPRAKVRVGDSISHGPGVTMADFPSKTLNRSFKTILFVDRLTVVKSPALRKEKVEAAHSQVGQAASGMEKIAPASVPKADGGYTVAELYHSAGSLAGKKVSVRARVVKFNRAIMGRNWLHLRDGTGAAPTNDVTVTTGDNAKVGDLLLVEGTVAVNKTFGAGYTYPLIIENATLRVENQIRR